MRYTPKSSLDETNKEEFGLKRLPSKTYKIEDAMNQKLNELRAESQNIEK